MKKWIILLCLISCAKLVQAHHPELTVSELADHKTSTEFPFLSFIILAMVLGSVIFSKYYLEKLKPFKVKASFIIFGIVAIGLSLGFINQDKTNTNDSSEIDANLNFEPQDYFSSYSLIDKNYGTKTRVIIKGDKRLMQTNAIPNHETGSFPNRNNPNKISSQKLEYTFPTNPIYTGKAKWAKEPGVALNGVKFDPQTAEVIRCESGENFRVEAIQDLIDLGLDFNNAHVQPTGAYHYHGVPTEVVKAFDSGEDLVHIGFALDGFPIYYSKSGAYKPSYRLSEATRTGTDCIYWTPKKEKNININGSKSDGTYISDWEFVSGLGDLDECNGIEINGEYLYLVTDEYPYVGRCLMGEFEEKRRMGPPPGRRPGQGPPPRRQRN